MRARRTRANPGEGPRLREDILSAAERLLVQAGSDRSLTLRAVAQEVGVTTPSLYLHFPDKTALVGAVCLRAWTQLGDRMRAAAAGHDDPFQALRARGRAYVQFGLDHPVQYRLLLLRPAPSGQRSAEVQAAEACLREVVHAVEACVRAGVLQGDPFDIALTLWATVHGCVSMLITQPPFPRPADLDRFINAAVRIAGLGAALATRLPADAPLSAAGLTERLDDLARQLVQPQR